MSTQIQLLETKPTYQEVEQALINVVKAGIYYRRPKEGKFMQSYKERIKKLRQAEDPQEYVLKLAMTIFPNETKYHKVKDDYKEYYGRDPKILNAIMELYKLYYKLAKDYFITDKQVDEETEDFLSSL
ncbi:6174_t:CDS:1 [Cetraspora pellucida]|uniref:6174_t:CDS:1 n=1 Tax=Cetraspora pellucida TaxID=1433469 RepID=A0ACA9MH82_9GLOM|nr:6174_t:CDS:1 [Cetraspora pellucida]